MAPPALSTCQTINVAKGDISLVTNSSKVFSLNRSPMLDFVTNINGIIFKDLLRYKKLGLLQINLRDVIYIIDILVLLTLFAE